MGGLLWGSCGRSVKVTTQLYLVLMYFPIFLHSMVLN